MEVRIDVDMRQVDQMLRVAPAMIRRGMEEAATDVQVLILNNMQNYPPQRPPANPRRIYKRLFNLQKSWMKVPFTWRGSTLVAEVKSAGNEAPYNIYVQKHGSQSRVHAGNWETELQVTQRLTPDIVRIAARSMNGATATLRR